MPMRRREFLGALAGGLAAASALRKAAAARKPNLIYCFSDEHRWQSMSFAELPEVHTPRMAELAKQGTEFTHCISNYPVCSPHRAILMTGRWPHQQGIIDNNIALSSDEMTLGKTFRNAGYDTCYIGKWHLGGTRAEPFGFDTSLIWSKTNAHYDTSSYHPAKGKPVTPKGYNATIMTDQALAYMEEHKDSGKPFFIMVSWNPPHARFTDPPPGKKALYPEGSLPYRPNVTGKHSRETAAGPSIGRQNSWPNYQGYHAHVSAIDDELGRVMDKLDEMGVAEDTILVYSSDHGSMFGSHGLGSKRQPYEESIRVPFLIRWPGKVPAGHKNAVLFGTIDVMPSLCALAGLPVPQSCEGQDFSGAMRGGKGPDPESQFIMHISKLNASGGNTHPAPIFRGVRTATHTYAIKPSGEGFLFDNRKDPYQLDNLFDDANHAESRRELEAVTRAWLKKTEDPFAWPEKRTES